MEDYIRAKFYCLYALADGNQCIQADAKVHLNSITYTASLLSSTWTYYYYYYYNHLTASFPGQPG